MKLIQGTHNEAKIFTDVIEESALSQITELCNNEAFKDSKIRIMPDVHAGKGCTIGTTMTLTNKVVPNLVGVDIGCGMNVYQITILEPVGIYDKINPIKTSEIDLENFDNIINQFVPSGMNVHSKSLVDVEFLIRQMICKDKLNTSRAGNSIGTLGGGNHFIELNKNEKDEVYLVIHSGSRNLGKQVAEHYQTKACELNPSMGNMAYLEGEERYNYINDMMLAQDYASYNRAKIADIIIKNLGSKFYLHPICETVHNYIGNDEVLRKGAVSAKENEIFIIPLNMKDGSLLCIGKGNEDWNNSAPHGAGRLMSRNQAKRELCLDEFKNSMEGIFTTSVNSSTLDESPKAYKDKKDIIDNISETCSIIEHLTPIYNYKHSQN